MDERFESELLILDKIRSEIDQEIKRIEKKEKQGREDFASVNRDPKVDLYINDIKSSYNNPYFGIVVLEDNNKNTRELHIGKKDLRIGNNRVVYDWRSDKGQTYYDRTNKKTLDGQYLLTNKKVLNIENGQIINIDKLENNDLILEATYREIVEKNRGNEVLGEVIASLNSEQIEVIRKNKEDSFIVQGYSGTGKTSLLFHRLSYIKYNYLDFDPDSVRVILPTNLAIDFVENLREQLDLKDIRLATKKSYYLELLNRFKPESLLKEKEILDDDLLDIDFIATVYSEDFIDSCNRSYEKYLRKLVVDLDLEEKLDLYGNNFNNIRETNIRKIDLFLRENEEKLSSLEKLDYRILELEKSLSTLNPNLDIEETLNILDRKKKLVGKVYEDRKFKKILEKVDLTLDDEVDNSSKEYFLKLIDRIKIKADDMESQLLRSKNTSNRESEKELAREFFNGELRAYMEIRNKNKEKINILKLELKKLSAFNLIKKSNLNSQIKLLKSQLKKNEELIEKHIYSLLELENQIDRKYDETTIKVLSDDDINYIRFLEREYGPIYDEIETIEGQLEFHKKNIRENREPGELEEKILLDYKEEYKILRKEVLSKEERNSLRASLNLLKYNDPNVVFNNTYGVLLRELLNSYNIDNSKRYIFNLYLYLNFYSLYKGGLDSKESLLVIDEGQDLFISEYRLLKKLNGKEVSFNIYGDTKKTQGKLGIQNWSKLLDIEDIYILRNNYRSGSHIIDFCNSEFNMDLRNFQLKDKPVDIISYDQLNSHIKKLEDENEEYNIISKNSLAYDQKISLEKSKGLEFYNLIVYTKDMDKRERYMSYSKAINSLTIVE